MEISQAGTLHAHSQWSDKRSDKGEITMLIVDASKDRYLDGSAEAFSKIAPLFNILYIQLNIKYLKLFNTACWKVFFIFRKKSGGKGM